MRWPRRIHPRQSQSVTVRRIPAGGTTVGIRAQQLRRAHRCSPPKRCADGTPPRAPSLFAVPACSPAAACAAGSAAASACSPTCPAALCLFMPEVGGAGAGRVRAPAGACEQSSGATGESLAFIGCVEEGFVTGRDEVSRQGRFRAKLRLPCAAVPLCHLRRGGQTLFIRAKRGSPPQWTASASPLSVGGPV